METEATLGRRGQHLGSDDDGALATWRAHDLANALHRLDREAIAKLDAPRALVLDLLSRADHAGEANRDLYSACASLGRLLAQAGASPSMAAATIDGAARALSERGSRCNVDRLAPARASVAEGYFAATLEAERAAARRAWEYPACVVPVADRAAAIASRYPGDDAEACAAWAGRIASGLARDGYRTAVIADGPAKAELEQALGLVGITVVARIERSRWLSFWKR